MAFDADEEILQDFLVEAGEILNCSPNNWWTWNSTRKTVICSMPSSVASTPLRAAPVFAA